MSREGAIRGRCLCGAVRFAAAGAPLWVGHCHCESCRRATASPFTTWVGVARTAFRHEGRLPSVYRSSEGVERTFCPVCGSPVSFASACWPDEIHLYAASLDDPEAVRPTMHVHVAEKLGWIALADGLPCHPGTAG